jgi:hypothetical protein
MRAGLAITWAATLAATVAATLAGCSRPGELATPRPLIGPGDAAGAPRFRTGLWRLIWPNTDDTPCPFDAAQPVQAWPSCDALEQVAPDRLVAIAYLRTPLGSIRTERRHAYILAAGSPLVMQVFGDAYAGRYSYEAVDDVTLDRDGRIVAARLTPIKCFDPTALTAAMERQANIMTDDNTHPIDDEPPASTPPALLPGFIRDIGGECRPRDLAALHNAAAADAAASSEGVNFRWVRDGDR